MTELVFILDRSGSMSGLESDTIGGFNSMIEKQKRKAGEALVSTVLFDNESVVIHDRLPLGRVPRMTEKEYFTRGCTALLDAVGGAIHHIGNIHMLIVGYIDVMLTHERAYAPNGSRMASVLCQKLSEKNARDFY